MTWTAAVEGMSATRNPVVVKTPVPIMLATTSKVAVVAPSRRMGAERSAASRSDRGSEGSRGIANVRSARIAGPHSMRGRFGAADALEVRPPMEPMRNLRSSSPGISSRCGTY